MELGEWKVEKELSLNATKINNNPRTAPPLNWRGSRGQSRAWTNARTVLGDENRDLAVN